MCQYYAGEFWQLDGVAEQALPSSDSHRLLRRRQSLRQQRRGGLRARVVTLQASIASSDDVVTLRDVSSRRVVCSVLLM